MGVDRAVLTVLLDAYEEEQVEGEKRVVLHLRPSLAPIKVAVMPLLRNRPELVEMGRRLAADLKERHAGHVRRHRQHRQAVPPPGRDRDAVLRDRRRRRRSTDGAATIRERDSMTQERVALERSPAASPTWSPACRVGGRPDRRATPRRRSPVRPRGPAPDRGGSSPSARATTPPTSCARGALLALGRLEEAEADAMDAVRLDPDEVRYRELLAEIQSRRGEHADAAAEYARLARQDPRQVAWTVAEAAERIEAADAARGVEAARRAVRLDPGNFDAQLALARGLIHLGDAAGGAPGRDARRTTCARPIAAAREALADALWLAGTRGRRVRRVPGAGARAAAVATAQRVVAKAEVALPQRRPAGSDGSSPSLRARSSPFALRRGWLDGCR